MLEVYKEMNGYNIARNQHWNTNRKYPSLPGQNLPSQSLFESPNRHSSAVKVEGHNTRSHRPMNTPKHASFHTNDEYNPEEIDYEDEIGYSRTLRSEFRKSRR